MFEPRHATSPSPARRPARRGRRGDDGRPRLCLPALPLPAQRAAQLRQPRRHRLRGEARRWLGPHRPGHHRQLRDARSWPPTTASSSRRATRPGYGNYVVIGGQGTRFDFVYGHMKGRSRVGAGRRVRAGQRIGSVGQTGTDSGVCHLHFELWKGRWFAGGSRTDPLPHLRAWDKHSGGPLQAEPKPPPGQYSASKRLFYDSAEVTEANGPLDVFPLSLQPRRGPLTVAGREVARIGLGTNRLASTPENHAFLREAVEAGVGHDRHRPRLHGRGQRAHDRRGALPSPTAWSSRRRAATTRRGAPGGASRADRAEPSASLRTDAIDLYYLHRVDPETPLEESLGVIAEYPRGGEDQGGRDLRRGCRADRRGAPGRTDRGGAEPVQRHRARLDDVVDYCEENGIVFVPYYPVARRLAGACRDRGGPRRLARRRSSSPGCCAAHR